MPKDGTRRGLRERVYFRIEPIFTTIRVLLHKDEGSVVNGANLLYHRRYLRFIGRRGRLPGRTWAKESPQHRNVFSFRGGGTLSDVSCLRADRDSLGAGQMAICARYRQWVVFCCRHDPFFGQSLPVERNRREMVGGDYTTRRGGISGRLGMPGVWRVAGVSVNAAEIDCLS